MFTRFARLATLFSVFAYCILAQGLDTRATKDDWEEINFEFNSATLSDGYPSLLRLADLLKANPGFKVRIEGHTDGIGGERANEKLGLARANTVRDFLVKYGAKSGQIETLTKGKKDPAVAGEKRQYSKTDVARWMNRRVVLTVMDDKGRTVGAGGAGDAIRAMDQAAQAAGMSQKCCEEILKRLDKLDDIAKMLRDLADQNAGLRRELDGLKQQQAALESKVNGQPKPLSESQTTAIVDKALAKKEEPKFQLLGVNVGADSLGHATVTGRARYFAPFAQHFAVQAQGEYYYWRDSKEGQFDLGLVDRFNKNFQASLFSSFKHVTLRGLQSGGTVGQAAVTFDYLFKRGKVGVFGTKGFLDNVLLDSRSAIINGPNGTFLAPNLFIEKYLRVVDQAGASTTLGLWGNNYLEANLGYLKSFSGADRPGGTVRFVFPVSNKFAFTVEGGVNETFLERGNSGRAVVGIQLGNFMRPKEYMGVDHPVPVDVPRVRYEVEERKVKRGTSPPIADAGPDQIGIPAGTVTLNGSNSYDPNGEKLTYTWVQESGNPVTISNGTASIASFSAAADNTYVFRLTVRNEDGLTASARTRVTTKANATVQILFFIANPTTIQQGKSAELSWKVINADTVSIGGIGTVAAEGKTSVSPSATTTYTLTARNANSEQNATATVAVEIPQTQILACYATPTNITQGEAATINYTTTNATRVTVTPDVGNVPVNGSFVVTPTQSTTYTLTAYGSTTQTASCSVGVTVNPPNQNTNPPRIIRFTAAPTQIIAGQKSTLSYQVEGADTITINPGVGSVQATGTSDVTPGTTTTYTLIATNKAGSSTAQATITVIQPAQITSFTANPPTSPAPGANVVLTCLATNATSVTIAGAGPLSAIGTTVVNPTVDTTYTCTATGNGTSDTKTLLVKVTQPPPPPPPPSGPPPTVVITGGPEMETQLRTIRLDASQSTSPQGNNPLTFKWVNREGLAAISPQTSPSPLIYLGGLAGIYTFDVTVTDSKGLSSTSTIVVKLVAPHLP